MIKLLHFADAHIDLARQGRHDPESGLPLRVLDFLGALDTIIDAAMQEKVDMVIFAGDAYRDRTPAPTYQREWGKRIMRLSSAGIQTLLVVGNHDISPAAGRAHTLQEFETLQVPNVHVISKPCLLGPEDLNGLPVQVIGIPWVNRSGLAAALAGDGEETLDVTADLESALTGIIEEFINNLDVELPAILTAHVTVQGAKYSSERSVMLGRDFTLAGSLVRDPRLDYVALGHIHQFQDLNEGAQPPVIYPGSIERVDFGERNDKKTYVIAEMEKGDTKYKEHELHGRNFLDCAVTLTDRDNVMQQIMKEMPSKDEIRDAIFRLVIDYPRDWEALIDEPAIRLRAQNAFEFHFIRRPHIQARLRLPGDQNAAALAPLELLDLYWDTVSPQQADIKRLNSLAGEIIHTVEIGSTAEEPGQGKAA